MYFLQEIHLSYKFSDWFSFPGVTNQIPAMLCHASLIGISHRCADAFIVCRGHTESLSVTRLNVVKWSLFG